MYSYIKGPLIEKTPTYIVIEAGGIGFHINISLNTYTEIGDANEALIHTHLVVREDAQILYGFAGKAERELFRQLITVSGVGANTARLILSSLSPDEVSDAITQARIGVLQSVKGIGGKTAQRIVVDLKDKITRDAGIPEKLEITHNTKKEEALSGLIILGFNKNAANKAIERVLKNTEKELSVEELIKNSLKIL